MKITVDKSVIEQALEELDIAQAILSDLKSHHHPRMLQAYTALRQTIEQAKKTQPVKVWDSGPQNFLNALDIEGWKARALKAGQAQPVIVRDETNVCYQYTALPACQPIAKVCHDLEGHIGWNPGLTELPREGTELYTAPPPRQPMTDEVVKLRGEMGVMVGLLGAALQVIETVDGDDADECQMLMELQNKITYAIQGAST